jgi:hypothetical protein
MNEEQISEALVNEVSPQVEQEVAPQEVAPQAPQVPTFDPAMLEAMAQGQEQVGQKLGNLEASLQAIQEAQMQANAPTPTEEEMIKAKLAEDLGLGDIKNQLQAKDQTIEEMKSMLQEFKQQQEISQRQQAVEDMSKRLDGFDEQLIIKELEQMNQVNPQMAQALNNPQGWEMLWNSKFANQYAKKPDPITPSETSGGEYSQNIASRFDQRTATEDDIGELLMSYVK